MLTMLTVIVGMMMVGMIVLSSIMLHHWLKQKEMTGSVETMQTKLFPEMEQMTTRMLNNIIKTTTDSAASMIKKMQEDQEDEY